MATHHGKEGAVKLGANAVGELVDWSYTETSDVAEDTVQGDSWKTFLPGHKEWRGSVTCRFDPDDTNGQNALVVGAVVSVDFYAEGAAVGDKYRSGSAIVTSVGVSVPLKDVVERSFELQGSGELTSATVGS